MRIIMSWLRRMRAPPIRGNPEHLPRRPRLPSCGSRVRQWLPRRLLSRVPRRAGLWISAAPLAVRDGAAFAFDGQGRRQQSRPAGAAAAPVLIRRGLRSASSDRVFHVISTRLTCAPSPWLPSWACRVRLCAGCAIHAARASRSAHRHAMVAAAISRRGIEAADACRSKGLAQLEPRAMPVRDNGEWRRK